VVELRNSRWLELVAREGVLRNAQKILIENCEGMGPLVKARNKWKDNIKVHIKGMKCVNVD
jgi:hypothetical protein